jgi:hypothetical protein
MILNFGFNQMIGKKEGLREGFRQEYNATISGAVDKINYYSSIGYLNQYGIQSGSSQNRLTARVKVDYQAKSWLKVGTNFNYTKYKKLSDIRRRDWNRNYLVNNQVASSDISSLLS